MRATAFLLLLPLWAQMAAVRAGGTDTQPATACANPHQVAGKLIVAAATGSTTSCRSEGEKASAPPPPPVVSAGFLSAAGFICLPERCENHFYSTTRGSGVSCGADSALPLDDSLEPFDEQHELLCGPKWSQRGSAGYEEERFCVGTEIPVMPMTPNTGHHPAAENISPSFDVSGCAAAAQRGPPLSAHRPLTLGSSNISG